MVAGVSFAFAPKYTSRALVMVDEQKVPEGYVQPVVTEDLSQRIASMEQQVLSRNRLTLVSPDGKKQLLREESRWAELVNAIGRVMKPAVAPGTES